MNTVLNYLFGQVAGFAPDSMEEICGSASNRRYVRLSGRGKSYIGVEGCDVRENAAFTEISRVFRSKGLPVPEVLAVSADGLSYIQEDFGTVMLSELVADAHRKGSFEELKPLLAECMRDLVRIQFDGGAELDFESCCLSPRFDLRMIMFDLNYFKYCLLKPSGIGFDENILQDEFEKFAGDLLSCRDYGRTFLYRDFQSRNVMVCNGKPYYIDFQGGRRGPVYYDLVSFVWQVRAAYPEEVKNMLVDIYLETLGRYVDDIDKALFFRELRLFRLFRLLQVLGAYGFRGVVEHKAKFVTSLIPALEDLKVFISEPFDDYPYLSKLLLELASLPRYASTKSGEDILEVKVYSFSYKKGIPEDYTGNGGGYVFDCRSIHNPGKYEQYRHLTGMDAPVIDFLEEDGEILGFLAHAEGVVDQHVETYIKRGFTNLSVAFGCTGGQHRSVYCAQHMAGHLTSKYPEIRVHLIHREQLVDKYL